MSNYMTTPEAAKALNRSTKTLYNWSAYGRAPVLPVKDSSHQLLWPAKTINKLVAKGFLDRPSTQAY